MNPWPFAVGGVVLAAFLLTAAFTSRVTEWLVMTDEMQYVKLAVGITRDGALIPQLHGQYYGSLNQLYPLLISPLVGLLDMPSAFRAAHWLNALIMASAAVPAYLLAKEVVRARGAALVAAALTVAVPWMAMSVMLMTEVAGYPAALWALLAMQRGLDRPSPRRDVVVALGLLLAVLARTQYLLFALAYPVVVVLHEAGWALAFPGGDRRRALRRAVTDTARRHLLLWIAVAVGVVVAIALAAAGRLDSVLGQYGATAHGDLLPPGIVRFALRHVDLLMVGLGVIPAVLGLGWVAGTLVRPSAKRMHAYAVLAIVVGTALSLQVASFDLRFVNGLLQTRYLLPLAPLFIVAATACVMDRRARWIGVVLAGVFLWWALPLTGYAPAPSPWFASPETAFHAVLWGRTRWVGHLVGADRLDIGDVLRWGTPVLAIALAAALRFAPRRPLAAVLGVLVLGFGVAETTYVLHTIVKGPNGARPVSGGTLAGRDWVDQATHGARVALLPVPLAAPPVPLDQGGYFSQQLWWDTEFWNKDVDQVYAMQGVESYSAWPKPLLHPDDDSGVLRVGDQHRYVVQPLSEVRWGLQGARQVAHTDVLELLEVPRPYRMSWATPGLGIDGAVFGPFRVRLFGGPQARRVTIDLGSLGPRLRYRLAPQGGTPDTGRIAAAAHARPAVTACVPPGSHADVTVSFPGTKPATPNAPLPVHVFGISADPAPGGC